LVLRIRKSHEDGQNGKIGGGGAVIGAFGKLRKATLSFVMSVRLPARM